jgi:hypothetical protein
MHEQGQEWQSREQHDIVDKGESQQTLDARLALGSLENESVTQDVIPQCRNLCCERGTEQQLNLQDADEEPQSGAINRDAGRTYRSKADHLG